MTPPEAELRESVCAAARALVASGLTQGTSGNVSARCGHRLLITPTAVAPADMHPEMVAAMPLADEHGAWEGPRPPSTEWRLHLDIARARPGVGAVVHAHPPYATALSMARRPIPACHYMIAAFGGGEVACAEYATFGTKELSEAALVALRGRTACLLANHGVVATGPDVAWAMATTVELEAIARQYLLALSIGGPVLLDDSELAATRAAIAAYGFPGPQASG